MTSYVDIANQTLSRLGHFDFITSLLDASDAAILINKNYEQVRDMVLRSHSWNFAKKRVVLAPSVTVPAFGYGSYFEVPGDWLRTIKDPDYGYDQFTMEGRFIRYDSASLDLFYIARITDPNQFDAMFIETYICALAKAICMALTGDKEKYKIMATEYKDALRNARSYNGSEVGVQEVLANTFLWSRY